MNDIRPGDVMREIQSPGYALYTRIVKQVYKISLLLICLIGYQSAFGQDTTLHKRLIDGEIVTAKVEDGDTLIMADLSEASVTSFRTFNSDTEYRRYMKYRRYALQVYPYAVESIKLFREVESETDDLNKRKRKKYIKTVQKDVRDEFTEPLKNLSRTQGKILIKMIERELDTPMYYLLKDLRNGFQASKWQTVGKMYGYDLKEGYIPGDDPILDAVLQDFDISHDKD